MNHPNTRELKALRQLTIEWEHRSKLGGAKTFAALIEHGWIEPFTGHNPFGDRYQITEAGRAARSAGLAPKVRRTSKLKLATGRLKELPPRLGRDRG